MALLLQKKEQAKLLVVNEWHSVLECTAVPVLIVRCVGDAFGGKLHVN